MFLCRRFVSKSLLRGSFASYSSNTKDVVSVVPTSAVKQWKKREQFTQLNIQRFEEQAPKNYYAPEWQIEQTDDKDRVISPLKNYGSTPEKWKYYNKVSFA